MAAVTILVVLGLLVVRLNIAYGVSDLALGVIATEEASRALD